MRQPITTVELNSIELGADGSRRTHATDARILGKLALLAFAVFAFGTPVAGAYELGAFDAKTARVRSQLPFSFAANVTNAYSLRHVQGSLTYAQLGPVDTDLTLFGGSGEWPFADDVLDLFTVSGIGAAGWATSDFFDGFQLTGGGKASWEGGPGNQFAAAAGLALTAARIDTDFGSETDVGALFFGSGRFTPFEHTATYLSILFGSNDGFVTSGFVLGGVYAWTRRASVGLEIGDVLLDDTAVQPFARYQLSEDLLAGVGIGVGDLIDFGAEAEVTYFF